VIEVKIGWSECGCNDAVFEVALAFLRSCLPCTPILTFLQNSRLPQYTPQYSIALLQNAVGLALSSTYHAANMERRGGGAARKTLLAPIHFIFSLLQKRNTVSIWLFENLHTRIEGKIRVWPPRVLEVVMLIVT